MASGDTLVTIYPQDNEPPSSNPATLDLRNNHPCLDFDGATNESAIFSAVMPQNYSQTTGVTVRLFITSDDTSGDTDWDVSFELCGNSANQDIDSDGFAAVNSTDNTTVPATSGYVQVIEVTFTDGADMDSVQPGDLFRIKVTRDAASDTSTGDAQLLAVEIQET